MYRLVLTLSLASSLATGCDLDEQAPSELVIVAPADETTFRDDDDVDPDVQGMQIDVRVEGQGEGHEIELLRLLGGAPKTVETAEIEDGAANFRSVTLLPGANRLQARDKHDGRTSQSLTVYYGRRCGDITFFEPMLAEGDTELVLGPADDRDAIACGDAFSVRLVAGTGLPDSSAVSVYAGDTLVGSGATSGGTLVIDPLVLDPALAEFGAEPFRLSFNPEDQGCGTMDYPVDVRIDCSGPDTCTIEDLDEEKPLTSKDDVDPDTPGLNIDVVVRTSKDARGKEVRLVVNDDVGGALVATADAKGPSARFSKVTLPEGTVLLDAVCADGVGNVSAATRRTVDVDSIGCGITITSPQPDSMIVAPGGSAAVTVNATLSGGDCELLYAAKLPDEGCTGLFDADSEMLAVGQMSVAPSIDVSGPPDASSSHTLCLGVSDLNGNETMASVRVVLVPP